MSAFLDLSGDPRHFPEPISQEAAEKAPACLPAPRIIAHIRPGNLYPLAVKERRGEEREREERGDSYRHVYFDFFVRR